MMKFRFVFTLIPVVGLLSITHAEIRIDENLQDRMQEVGPAGTVSALVFMDEQVDIKSLSNSISKEKLKRSPDMNLLLKRYSTWRGTLRQTFLNPLRFYVAEI